MAGMIVADKKKTTMNQVEIPEGDASPMEVADKKKTTMNQIEIPDGAGAESVGEVAGANGSLYHGNQPGYINSQKPEPPRDTLFLAPRVEKLEEQAEGVQNQICRLNNQVDDLGNKMPKPVDTSKLSPWWGVPLAVVVLLGIVAVYSATLTFKDYVYVGLVGLVIVAGVLLVYKQMKSAEPRDV